MFLVDQKLLIRTIVGLFCVGERLTGQKINALGSTSLFLHLNFKQRFHMVYMNDVLYGRALEMIDSGQTIASVAAKLHVSHRTIRYWMAQQHAPSQPRSKQKTSKKASTLVAKRRRLVAKLISTETRREGEAFTPKLKKRKVRWIVLRPYDSPARVSRALFLLHGVKASLSTVRRDLQSLGMSAKHVRPGPVLTPAHMQYRIGFSKTMLNSDYDVMFSDEKQFDSNQQANSYQWVRDGVAPPNRMMEQGPPSITVWGCIGVGFKCIIVLERTTLTMESYRELVLKKAVKEIRCHQEKRRGEGFHPVFQQDGRPHCRSEKYLHKCRVATLWPALSCDMSPIEQLWQLVDYGVKRRGPYGVGELRKFVEEEFAAFEQSRIDKLVLSFRDRCAKVIAARGRTVKP